LDRRLGGLQSRSGCGGEEKNSQPLPGLELPIIQPVAQRYTTELSRLLTIEEKKDKVVLDLLKGMYRREKEQNGRGLTGRCRRMEKALL
jgi:hypothetical protein